LKPAFLFLTVGNVTQPALWQDFFKSRPKGTEFSLYCHAKLPEKIAWPFLRDRIIRDRIPTAYGHISLVRATMLLFREALKDKSNTHFLFLSDSCVPLYAFASLQEFLSQTDKSFIRHEVVKNLTSDLRWSQLRDTNFLARDQFYKQHQWMILHRDAVEAILCEDFTEQYELMFAPDEYYFIQALFRAGFPVESRVENRQTTFVDWKNVSRTLVEKAPGVVDYDTRPRTFKFLTMGEAESIRKMGCLFLRKVDAQCSLKNIFSSGPPLPSMPLEEARTYEPLRYFFYDPRYL
jgi:hypothetical protein